MLTSAVIESSESTFALLWRPISAISSLLRRRHWSTTMSTQSFIPVDIRCQHSSYLYVLSMRFSAFLWDPSSVAVRRGSNVREQREARPLPCHEVTQVNLKLQSICAQVWLMFFFLSAFPLASCKEADLRPKCLPLVIFPLINPSFSQGLLRRIYRLN